MFSSKVAVQPEFVTWAHSRSAVAQPSSEFEGVELYPTLVEKAAVLCFSLVQNHPFIDGNKRIGHAAMEAFLMMNGMILQADVDDAEATILGLADGKVTRDELTAWLRMHASQDSKP